MPLLLDYAYKAPQIGLAAKNLAEYIEVFVCQSYLSGNMHSDMLKKDKAQGQDFRPALAPHISMPLVL